MRIYEQVGINGGKSFMAHIYGYGETFKCLNLLWGWSWVDIKTTFEGIEYNTALETWAS